MAATKTKRVSTKNQAMLVLRQRRRERFGLELYRIRDSRNISQADLARICGVSQTLVGQWERGLSAPIADMVFQIEDDLALDPGRLSHFLGYGRVDPDGTVERVYDDDIVSFLDRQHDLADRDRRLLLLMFKEMTAK